MRNLTAPQLKAHLEQSETRLRLVDVREPWEFAICHIEGSELLPMRQIPAAAHSRLSAEEPTVVICHHGVRSLQVAIYLERLGFRDVINLQGGVDAWAREVDPGMPVY